MDLKKLSILKEKMMNSKDFKDAWYYFFENLGNDPSFIQFGNRVENEMLKAIANKICQQFFQKTEITVSQLLLTEIESHHFIHGAAFVQNKMISIFFFEDIDMGVFAMARLGNPEISLARFNSLSLENDKNIFFAPSTTKQISRKPIF